MIQALSIALAIAVALLLVQTHRVHALRLSAAENDIALANAEARAEQVARDTSTSIVDALYGADAMYQRGLTDAQAVSDRDAVALRRGALRLRHEWAACETGRLADGAATQRELDQAAERRSALALEIVHVGAECDAKEKSLIAAYDAVRLAINRGAP